MNFNHYYQSFNNEAYEPINNSIVCAIFRLIPGWNTKEAYTELFYYEEHTNEWYSNDYRVKNSEIVEFIPIYPLDKYPAKERKSKNVNS